MKPIFQNTLYFSILYVLIFMLDAFVKVIYPLSVFRYFTKTLLIIVLLYYFVINNNETSKNNIRLFIFAIISFIIGDILIVAGNINQMYLILGVVFFAIGKTFYSIRFSNRKDFDIIKLLPFLLFCFTYMCGVMILVYDSIGSYFIPLLIYLFVVMITAQFAYLRKGEVNYKSYILVLIGVVFSMFSDSITILKEFYDPDIAYHQYSIMLFYALSQYFIVIGITKEKVITKI